MKVKEIMTADVRTCNAQANLAAVAEIMREGNYGTVPVVSGDKVIGLISDRDVCLAVGKNGNDAALTTVREVISGKVYNCAPTDDVKDALKTMRKRKVQRLSVVNSAGLLKGILSIDDALLHARKAKGKKSRRLSYKDVARTFQAIYEPRVTEPTKTLAGKQASPQESYSRSQTG